MESRCWTPSSSGFSPTHQRYWSYLDLLVENDWLLSQQGGTFLCQSATNHTSLRIAWDIQAWFDDEHPILIVEKDSEMIAFASSSAYSARECYAGIAECSVYVKRDMRGHGAGRFALEALIRAAEDAGFWKLVSRVFVENKASRKLIGSLGFREVGIYEKHAKLHGIW